MLGRDAGPEEGIERVEIRVRDVGEMLVGERWIEVLAVPAHAVLHRSPERGGRPAADPGFRVRSQVALTGFHGHCYAAEAAAWNAATFCSGVK
jgi:hypothetical protein